MFYQHQQQPTASKTIILSHSPCQQLQQHSSFYNYCKINATDGIWNGRPIARQFQGDMKNVAVWSGSRKGFCQSIIENKRISKMVIWYELCAHFCAITWYCSGSCLDGWLRLAIMDKCRTCKKELPGVRVLVIWAIEIYTQILQRCLGHYMTQHPFVCCNIL